MAWVVVKAETEEDAENDLIEVARGYGAVIILIDARDRRFLRKAGLLSAGHLVAVGGDDGTNAEAAVVARRVAADRKGLPLSCLVHIVDPELCNLLRLQEIGSQHHAPFRLDFLDVFEGGARRFEPLDMAFESRAFAEARFLFDDHGALSASAVFVCPDDDSRGLSAGLTLSRRVKGRGVPIIVRTVHASGLAYGGLAQ